MNITLSSSKRFYSFTELNEMGLSYYKINRLIRYGKLVDILYYRNKVGIEETKEVLKNYLGREDRNLIKLHRYAEELGCSKILGTYLEVLL